MNGSFPLTHVLFNRDEIILHQFYLDAKFSDTLVRFLIYEQI